MIEDVAGKFNLDAAMGNGVTRDRVGVTSLSIDNGPYGHPSWKQIRGADHPVARFLRRNNIVSVSDEPKQIIIPQGDTQLSVKAKRGNTVSNFVEPPITSKYKPIAHNVILKGTSDPLIGHRIKHTYANNLVCYSNKNLNKKLGLVKVEEQMYDRLREFYLDPDFEEGSNPINKFLTLTYGEVIYPKEENTYLGKIRGRQKYILDLPGFTSNGYDRLFGTQRTFWREGLDERRRSGFTGSAYENSALNSQNFHIGHPLDLKLYEIEIPDSYPIRRSVFPMDEIELSGTTTHSSSALSFDDGGGNLAYSSRYNILFNGGGELNNEWLMCSKVVQTTSVTIPLSTGTRLLGVGPQDETRYFDSNVGAAFETVVPDYLSLSPRAKYVVGIGGAYWNNINPSPSIPEYTASLFDAGLNWQVAKLAGKDPWYPSYDGYSSDIRAIGKDYTIVPEFNISEHMNYYILDVGGNFREQNNAYLTLDGTGLRDVSAITNTSAFDSGFFATYAHSDLLREQSKISSDHKQIAEIGRISLKCKGIKKLLPYNGFYPIQRMTQLASIFSQSIGTYVDGGYFDDIGLDQTVGNIITGSAASETAKMYALLQPFYAPGLAFNAIKSGLAVDWPITSASFIDIGTPGDGIGNVVLPEATTPRVHVDFGGYQDIAGSFLKGTPVSWYDHAALPKYRLPFEALIKPQDYIPHGTLKQDIQAFTDPELDTPSNYFILTSSIFPYSYRNNSEYHPLFDWDHTRDSRYELAANNFYAEVVKFFIKDSKLTSFRSNPVSKWRAFEAGKTYYMDVVLKKDKELVMIESYQSESPLTIVGANGERDSGRYFGWAFAVSDDLTVQERIAGTDPQYAPFTPPYFEGESVARISFAPETSKNYSLQEIFSSASVEYINAGLLGYEGTPSFLAASNVNSSVNSFGVFRDKEVTYDQGSVPKLIIDSNNPDNDSWVIATRFESPVLDFSSQEKQTLTEMSFSFGTPEVDANDDLPELFDIGFGRGMWSGYGDIPSDNKGIFLELKDSFSYETNKTISSLTASLLDQVGFISEQKRTSVIADQKIISEAIIAIPFLDSKGKNTIEIDCKNLIGINRKFFELQKKNLNNGEPAIKTGDFGSTGEIRVTSVSDMIEKMGDYVIPPQYNFLEYSDIQPFAMYIFEFKHVLDRQDLADIWQGVMPKIAMTPEKDEIEVDHPMGKFEFFGEKGLPDNLRWMILKVKKKAEKNYFAVTADSTDDDRFKFNFKVGRKAPEYSYNWPYDFFSLVELAKVEIELEYKNDDREQKFLRSESPVTDRTDERTSGERGFE